MKILVAFFKLIRVLNLLFIILTQGLFQYMIVVPMMRANPNTPALPPGYFALVVLSSVLIAAAGYIINDYFDLNIDRINKPDKIVVERMIKRRWAIIWHLIFSFIGVLIGFYVGWKTHVFWLGFANLGCVLALWFYSTTFKKKLLAGNVIISLLTAWVVMVIGFATHYRLVTDAGLYGVQPASKLLRYTFLYAGFAFIISLIREVVKDVEDMAGDAKYGCRTMPIVWGVHVSKVFAGTWLAVLTAALFIVFAYVLQLKWWLSASYCLVFVIVPLLIVLRRFAKAETPRDFGNLSGMIKFVMLTGILSMAFF
ncbi:MAG: geranylgeranylglycerol-phosphate geranylgeranyltransferase [Chitinophagaceae bacterium]|nr:geranylgeranylglycerol-phosphate geranylgeranyltransferase [Chitinophagaceae bacterium]